jgi:LEA14-like dessication related protein
MENTMSVSRTSLLPLLALAVLLLSGCAALQYREPINVSLAGIESLPGEGMEIRMLLRLRVQNPNDKPLDYNGISIRMDVQGKRFASGVSDASGSIPRFGEAVVQVPVSVSVLGIARQAIGIARDEHGGKLPFEINGKLAGPGIGGVRFHSQGDFTMPMESSGGDK